MADTIQALASILAKALRPFAETLGAADYDIAAFVEELGYILPFVPPSLIGLSNVSDPLLLSIETVEEELIRIDEGMGSDEALIAALVELLIDVEQITQRINGLRTTLADELPATFVAATNIDQNLTARLYDYLLIDVLEKDAPMFTQLMQLLGVIEVTEQEENVNHHQPAFVLHKIWWDRVPKLFHNPTAVFAEVYGWGTSEIDVERLFDYLMELSLFVFAPARIVYPSDRLIESVGMSAHIASDEGPDPQLVIPFLETDDVILSFAIYPLPTATPVEPQGLALTVIAGGEIDADIPIADRLVLCILADVDLASGAAMVIRPEQPVSIVAEVEREGTAHFLKGARIELRLKYGGEEPWEPVLLLSAPDGSRVEAKQLYLAGRGQATTGAAEVFVETGVSGGKIVLSMSDADSFLSSVLPSQGFEIPFDFGLGWSSQRGVFFRGGAGLETTIPLHFSAGPISIQTLQVLLKAGTNGLDLELGLSGGLALGPVTATVQSVGIESFLAFDEGNLGPVDFGLAFKPPNGVGLSIDASGIVGGGFLEFDDANKRYAGVLALNFSEIGLTAIGLITTRLPDGSPGFALLINIGVTFDPPIQLSFGFTLSGVGGLIGVNRSMEIDVLRTGLKNHTLDAILFPDPDTVIANASQIISDLRAVFPPADGRYVVGPMVRIGWGSPTIVTAELGIFLEFPDPIRLVLMGQVEAAFPEEDKALILIHLDILGVVDFAKEELTFQACLYDSRVMSYSLSGDSAFLLGWGRNPRFALALGGFHPRFTPPPPPIVFADLKRLTLSISKAGGALQLSCQAYQALTPNTLQFGAPKVSLYASAGATAEGYLGFDALFYFSPFSFEVEIRGGVYIKYEGVSLVDVHLTLFLSGPTPWHARGKAKIKILLLSIEVGFCFEWGSGEQATLPPVDPWELLQDALADSGNWGSLLPAGRPTVASLRSLETEEPGQIVVHPAGRLEVRQNVVPLGVRLEKVGNAPITGHDLFDITDLCVNGDSLRPLDPVEEFFARGQFEELSADQKLSLPAFEKMKGGVTTAASAGVRIDGDFEFWPLAYESILIKPDRTSQDRAPEGEVDWFDWQHAELIVKTHTTRRAAQRAGPRKRFSTLRPQPRVGVSEERYCIAKASNLTLAELDPALGRDNGDMTRMVADQVLKAQIEHRPDQAGELLVIPECEVAA